MPMPVSTALRRAECGVQTSTIILNSNPIRIHKITSNRRRSVWLISPSLPGRAPHGTQMPPQPVPWQESESRVVKFKYESPEDGVRERKGAVLGSRALNSHVLRIYHGWILVSICFWHFVKLDDTRDQNPESLVCAWVLERTIGSLRLWTASAPFIYGVEDVLAQMVYYSKNCEILFCMGRGGIGALVIWVLEEPCRASCWIGQRGGGGRVYRER